MNVFLVVTKVLCFYFRSVTKKIGTGRKKTFTTTHFQSLDDIPQMVVFSFNDPVNEDVYEHYMELFYGKLNPNGCPVSVTIFVSDNNTDYCMINKLYTYGHEIGNRGKTSTSQVAFWQRASVDEWRQEVVEQIDAINQKAEIPRSAIRGWRTPLNQPGGDKQFKLLQANNFIKYDSTLLAGPMSLNENSTWPFTLDKPLQFPCGIPPCPQQRYQGFWEVPIIRLLDANGLVCSFAHRCIYPPNNEQETCDFLWKNFEHHYRTNRAPFMVNLEANWFNEKEFALKAMKKFIAALLSRKDVYIVSAWQVVQWMQDPTPMGREGKMMENFEPWKAHCNRTMSRRMKCKLKRKQGGFLGLGNLMIWQWGIMTIILLVLVARDWNADK